MDPENDDMPMIPMRSRHQNRQPVKPPRNRVSSGWRKLLPPDRIEEREARVQEFCRRAELGLPLFPDTRPKESKT